MGKKRINQLLNQLQTNHEVDRKNAAAIFTVAQVAVNQLEHQSTLEQKTIPVLTSAPLNLSKETLQKRFGSFNACRAAARQQGIHFKKTPTWEQLGEAFAYFEDLQRLIRGHLSNHPSSKLDKLSMTFNLDELQ
jgi:hypothetical protein